MSDEELTMYERLESRPECSGHITLDLKMLDMVQESGQHVWREILVTQIIEFNELGSQGIRHGEEGLTLHMRPEPSGQSQTLFWPWSAIQHYTITSNTDDEAKALYEWSREQEIHDYAQRGADLIEGLLNNHGPHGLGCKCPPDDDEDFDDEPEDYEDNPVTLDLPFGGKVLMGPPTPCGHNMAMKSINDLWTCVVCALRWNDDGKVFGMTSEPI